jgi:hypothetical protein
MFRHACDHGREHAHLVGACDLPELARRRQNTSERGADDGDARREEIRLVAEEPPHAGELEVEDQGAERDQQREDVGGPEAVAANEVERQRGDGDGDGERVAFGAEAIEEIAAEKIEVSRDIAEIEVAALEQDRRRQKMRAVRLRVDTEEDDGDCAAQREERRGSDATPRERERDDDRHREHAFVPPQRRCARPRGDPEDAAQRGLRIRSFVDEPQDRGGEERDVRGGMSSVLHAEDDQRRHRREHHHCEADQRAARHRSRGREADHEAIDREEQRDGEDRVERERQPDLGAGDEDREGEDERPSDRRRRRRELVGADAVDAVLRELLREREMDEGVVDRIGDDALGVMERSLVHQRRVYEEREGRDERWNEPRAIARQRRSSRSRTTTSASSWRCLRVAARAVRLSITSTM